MTNELDALIIRSLPELNDAATRLSELDIEIGKEIDAEIHRWIARNGWKGVAENWGEDGQIYLSPEDWIVPSQTDEGYLYFLFDYTGSNPADGSHLVSLTGGGQQQSGFWLQSDRVKTQVFKKLWKTHLASASGLPLHGSEFFLPITLNPEDLATAVMNGSVSDAFGPLRETLERLPELASRLGSFTQAIAAAADDVSGPET